MKNVNDVLFQKIGNTWFAFTKIKDDVFYTTLPQGMDPKETSMEFYEVIEDHMQNASESYNGNNNKIAS